MSVYVFLGPTLSPAVAAGELDAVYLPPAAQGDVYRLVMRRPRAIGIVDGYFHQVPAIWHKEVLWAMSQGIHVYGASSMGALRAAELDQFGMTGVGEIYESFRDGVLEDDDEVALVHGPAESGYRGLSEAMVNIRATLAKAAADKVLSEPTRLALTTLAKALFYPNRLYPEILRCGREQGLPQAELDRLREWLPNNRVDQKRLDALAMLRRIRADLAGELAPKRVDYKFAHTRFWEDLVQSAGGIESQAGSAHQMVTTDAILDELRLEGLTSYRQARDAALLRSLALRVAEQQRYGVDADALARQAAKLQGVTAAVGTEQQDEDLALWLADNQLGPAQLDAVVREEALIEHVLSNRLMLQGGQILSYLRMSGRYGALRARALDKRRRLEAAGMREVRCEQVGLSRDELLQWYFDRIGPFVPSSVRHHLQAFEFPEEDDLINAVLQEYCYEQLLSADNSSATSSDSWAAPGSDTCRPQ